MSLHLTFRNLQATDSLKAHVEKKVAKFRKFITYPTEVHVLLSVEKTFQTAEITVHAEHRDLVAVAKSKNMYESIDLAGHKIEAQMKKEREKKKGHTAAKLVSRKAAKLGSDVPADLPHKEKKARR